MSRKRHPARPAAKIDWLEHRTGYPSPQEREAIIIRRNQLRLEFIGLVARDQLPDSPAGRRLVEKYGKEELNVILEQFDRAFQNNNIVETGFCWWTANYGRTLFPKTIPPSGRIPAVGTCLPAAADGSVGIRGRSRSSRCICP